jgi:hypothetical protein
MPVVLSLNFDKCPSFTLPGFPNDSLLLPIDYSFVVLIYGDRLFDFLMGKKCFIGI